MAEVEIRKFDDPILRQKTKPVRRINATIRKILDDMAETLYAAKGVGLAAPQIGLDKAIVVIDVGEGLIELVNPRIVQAEGTAVAVEGCLSLPGMSGEVPRADKVKVEALDGNGHRTWVEGDGLLARALQHEIDHLDGVLFIDKATSISMEDEDEGEAGREEVREEGREEVREEGREEVREEGREAGREEEKTEGGKPQGNPPKPKD